MASSSIHIERYKSNVEENFTIWTIQGSNIIDLFKFDSFDKYSTFSSIRPFQSYVQKILQPIYQDLGGLNADRNQNDRLDIVKHKVLVSSWACRFDVDDCQEKSKSLFHAWMEEKEPEKENP